MKYYPELGKYILDPHDQDMLALHQDFATVGELHTLRLALGVELAAENSLLAGLRAMQTQGVGVPPNTLKRADNNVERLSQLHFGLAVAVREGFDDQFAALVREQQGEL